MPIIPAIIPESYEDLRAHISRVKGFAARVQIDVLDGRYTKTSSWPYNKRDQDEWKKLIHGEEGLPSWEDISYEIDLMVQEPEKNIADWIGAGADTLIIHSESTERFEEICPQAREYEVAIALALRPSTSEDILETWAHELAFVQVMGSDTIGRQGIALEEEKVCAKIAAIRARYPELAIGVDIGVNEETIPLLMRAGATRFAAGSAIFKSGNPRTALLRLENIAQKSRV